MREKMIIFIKEEVKVLNILIKVKMRNLKL